MSNFRTTDGGEFTLFTLGNTDIDISALEQAAAELHIPFAAVDIPNEEVRDSYGYDLVLIRPINVSPGGVMDARFARGLDGKNRGMGVIQFFTP